MMQQKSMIATKISQPQNPLLLQLTDVGYKTSLLQI